MKIDNTKNDIKVSTTAEKYKKGDIGLGRFCKILHISKQEGLKTLINVIDYDFSADLKGIDKFLKK